LSPRVTPSPRRLTPQTPSPRRWHDGSLAPLPEEEGDRDSEQEVAKDRDGCVFPEGHDWRKGVFGWVCKRCGRFVAYEDGDLSALTPPDGRQFPQPPHPTGWVYLNFRENP
jgi:hypothetical protein